MKNNKINKWLAISTVCLLLPTLGGFSYANTVKTENESLKAKIEKNKDELTKLNTEVKEKKETLKVSQDAVVEQSKKVTELTTNVENLTKEKDKLATDFQAKEAELAEVKQTKVAQAEVKEEAKPVATAVANPEPVAQSGTPAGNFTVTHYSVGDGMTPSTTTANGTDVSSSIYTAEGHRIIATSTSVLPMNSIVKITLSSGESFTAKVCDTGSAIVNNKIDLLVSTPSEAIALGVTGCTIEIIG